MLSITDSERRSTRICVGTFTLHLHKWPASSRLIKNCIFANAYILYRSTTHDSPDHYCLHDYMLCSSYWTTTIFNTTDKNHRISSPIPVPVFESDYRLFQIQLLSDSVPMELWNCYVRSNSGSDQNSGPKLQILKSTYIMQCKYLLFLFSSLFFFSLTLYANLWSSIHKILKC